MRIYGSLLLVMMLTMSAQVQAQTTKTKSKEVGERAAGTTSSVGNRCPGGTYNTCYNANIKAGWKASSAATHCARTCQ